MNDEQQAPASAEAATGTARRKLLVMIRPDEGETPVELNERYVAALYSAMAANEHTTDLKGPDIDDD